MREIGLAAYSVFFVLCPSFLPHKRHRTDYSPDRRLRKTEMVADIGDARTTIARFRATPASRLRAFTIYMPMKVGSDA